MSNARELAELSGSYGTGGFVGMKNRIINGAMLIDQRNAGASKSIATGTAQYTVDRYFVNNDADSVLAVIQDTSAPARFTNSLKVTVSTADASIGATQNVYVAQNIEGYNVADFGQGAAGAATYTLSFWVRSSLTGTFGGVFGNSSLDYTYPFTYTISAANTWEQKTITVSGAVAGTWLTTNGIGLRVFFALGTGSTYLGTANAWAATQYRGATGQTQVISTVNATWQVTGVQLEKGSTATSFDYRPYGTELSLCQRYYQQFGPYASAAGLFATGYIDGTTQGRVYKPLLTSMRASPTVSASAGNTFLIQNNSVTAAGTAFSTYKSTPENIAFIITSSGLTAGQGCLIFDNSSTSAAIYCTSEL
jgi:hypothetical protein